MYMFYASNNQTNLNVTLSYLQRLKFQNLEKGQNPIASIKYPQAKDTLCQGAKLVIIGPVIQKRLYGQIKTDDGHFCSSELKLETYHQKIRKSYASDHDMAYLIFFKVFFETTVVKNFGSISLQRSNF